MPTTNPPFVYKEYHFDNNNKTSGTLSEPTFVLKDAIQALKGLRLKSVGFCKSFYAINSFNNVLVIQEDMGASFNVVIPEGNYTTTTFKAVIETALNTASVNTYTYTYTYIASTGKITIAVSAGTYSILSGTANLLIGFNPVGQATTHTGDLVQRITTFPECIYLQSTQGLFLNAPNGENLYGTSDILDKLYTNGDYFSTIVQTNFQEEYFTTNSTITSVAFNFVYKDINNPNLWRVVDFNGGSFNITFSNLHTLYQF